MLFTQGTYMHTHTHKPFILWNSNGFLFYFFLNTTTKWNVVLNLPLLESSPAFFWCSLSNWNKSPNHFFTACKIDSEKPIALLRMGWEKSMWFWNLLAQKKNTKSIRVHFMQSSNKPSTFNCNHKRHNSKVMREFSTLTGCIHTFCFGVSLLFYSLASQHIFKWHTHFARISLTGSIRIEIRCYESNTLQTAKTFKNRIFTWVRCVVWLCKKALLFRIDFVRYLKRFMRINSISWRGGFTG